MGIPSPKLSFVSFLNSDEEIASTIASLAKKTIGHSCRKCLKQEEDKCLRCKRNWLDSRNSVIKILRSLLEVPKEMDVPKLVVDYADSTAQYYLSDTKKNHILLGLKNIRDLHERGELKKEIPAQVVCPVCQSTCRPSYMIEEENCCTFCASLLRIKYNNEE